MVRLGTVAALMATIVALTLAVSACGGGAAQEEKARKIPENSLDTEGKPLPPGEYTTDEFKPAMSFRLGKGWHTYVEGAGSREEALGDFAEMSDYLFLVYAPDDKLLGTVEFMVDHWALEIVGPLKVKEIRKTPKPMVTWLRNNPYLRTEKPEPTGVGGKEGVSFDAVASGGMDETSVECLPYSEPCVPLFRNAANPGSYYDLAPGEKARFVVLEDVKDEEVTIALTAPTVKFDEFVPEAQKMLKTVEWKGA
jgi:hypothetical protein